MRRAIIEPTTDDLIDAIDRDSLKRNQDIKAFVELLDTIEGGYSFCLDGAWGDGKTFFVLQTALVLENLNTKLDPQTKLTEAQMGQFMPSVQNLVDKPDSPCNPDYLPVYFNCWKHDSHGEPVFSLALEIAERFGLATKDKPNVAEGICDAADDALQPLKEIFSTAFSLYTGIPISLGNISLKQVMESFSSQELLDAYRKRATLEELVNRLIDGALKNRADKIVLFIDELDRCKPGYAIAVLESIKHLFTNDKVIVVFSIDSRQLAFALQGIYGPEFDGTTYLRRFFDSTVPLRPINNINYAMALAR